MVHGKLGVEIWDHAASGHVDASSLSVGHLLCFRCFLPKSRAGAAGKPKKNKKIKKGQNSCRDPQDPRSHGTKSPRVEKYNSVVECSTNSEDHQARYRRPMVVLCLERLTCDPRRYPGSDG